MGDAGQHQKQAQFAQLTVAQSRADPQLIGQLFQDRKQPEGLAHAGRAGHRGLIEISPQRRAQSSHPLRRPLR